MVLKRIGIFATVFLLAFFACKTHYSVTKTESQHQDLKEKNSIAAFDSIIFPYKSRIGNEMEKQLVMCSGDLTKDGVETTLGNFVCDAVKWAYDSINGGKSNTIVLMNRGGLRANLNKGMITIGSLFELMPFDNELETVTISGQELQEAIKLIIEKKHAFLGMSIHVTTNDNAIVYEGKAIDPSSNYTVVTSDFLVNGGDNFKFGAKPVHDKKMNLKIRDALINYCLHLKYTGSVIKPYKDGRFEISK